MRIGGRVQSAGGGFGRGCGMDGHVTIAMVGFTWAWRMGWSREFKVKMSRVQYASVSCSLYRCSDMECVYQKQFRSLKGQQQCSAVQSIEKTYSAYLLMLSWVSYPCILNAIYPNMSISSPPTSTLCPSAQALDSDIHNDAVSISHTLSPFSPHPLERQNLQPPLMYVSSPPKPPHEPSPNQSYHQYPHPPSPPPQPNPPV
jgi:hypothetical protein